MATDRTIPVELSEGVLVAVSQALPDSLTGNDKTQRECDTRFSSISKCEIGNPDGTDDKLSWLNNCLSTEWLFAAVSSLFGQRMNRRSFLTASASGIFVGLSGCLNTTQAATDTTTTNETEHCARSIVLTDVFPREMERNYIDGEYVRLENIATKAVDVTDYVVEYEEGTEFSLPEITMEPGSMLELISRQGEDATLESNPPVYLVYASFGENLETSVMNGSGAAKLRSPDGTLIDKIRYSEQPK